LKPNNFFEQTKKCNNMQSRLTQIGEGNKHSSEKIKRAFKAKPIVQTFKFTFMENLEDLHFNLLGTSVF
jgi:hypothetical protein